MNIVEPYAQDLCIGNVRTRFSLRPGRFAGWLLGTAIRYFRLARQQMPGEYSHTFLWWGDEIWEAAGTWRHGGIEEYNKSNLIVDCFYAMASRDEQEAAWHKAESMEGQLYDTLQLLKIGCFELGITHHDFDPDPGKPICSAGVAECYLAAGINLFRPAGVPLWRFAPDHVAKLHRLKPGEVQLLGRLAFD